MKKKCLQRGHLTKIFKCVKVFFRAYNYAQLRAKDDPYGLAPIRVTDAESKPSTPRFPKGFGRWVQAVSDGGFCLPPQGKQPFGIQFVVNKIKRHRKR